MSISGIIQLPVKSALILIRGVLNPSLQNDFNVQIRISNAQDLLWYYSNSFDLVLSNPVDYLLMKSISVSDSDTRYPSVLTIVFAAPNNNSVLPVDSYSSKIIFPSAY